MYNKTDDVKQLVETMHELSINVKHYFQKNISQLDLDVTYEMVQVLVILSQSKHMNQQQIADVTVKNKASLTSLIDNMQKRNLVMRNEDTEDRRNKIITLTPKGKEAVAKVQPVIDEMFYLLYNHIPRQEIEMMNKTTVKMNRAIVSFLKNS